MNACYLGLTMNKDEARARIREAFDIVSHFDIQQWGEDFFAAVQDSQATLLEFDVDAVKKSKVA